VPQLGRLGIDGRNLPLLERTRGARRKPLLLFLLGDVEIVFAQRDAVAYQHRFERHDVFQKRLDLRFGREAHHALDTRTVVPGAVEHDEFVGTRQEADEALEIPLRLLAVRGLARRMYARIAWTHMLDEALDRAVLARAVASF